MIYFFQNPGTSPNNDEFDADPEQTARMRDELKQKIASLPVYPEGVCRDEEKLQRYRKKINPDLAAIGLLDIIDALTLN